MFCPKCGTQQADGRRFCGNCGYEIAQAVVQQSAPAAAVPSAYHAPAGSPTAVVRKKPIVPIVAAVAVVAIVVIVLFATGILGGGGLAPGEYSVSSGSGSSMMSVKVLESEELMLKVNGLPVSGKLVSTGSLDGGTVYELQDMKYEHSDSMSIDSVKLLVPHGANADNIAGKWRMTIRVSQGGEIDFQTFWADVQGGGTLTCGASNDDGFSSGWQPGTESVYTFGYEKTDRGTFKVLADGSEFEVKVPAK